MSRHAVPALILITCDGRRGEWVSLHAMAGRLGLPADEIRRHADTLTAQGLISFATHAGHPYWGVGVEGHMPGAAQHHSTPQSPNQSNPEKTHD